MPVAAILEAMNDKPSPDGSQLPTRTQWAHDQLRLAILNGEYAPGDHLVISTLAREMGVSATPLREALGNLAASGLIELQTHGKARVAKVELHEANEIYELRLMLEPVALERAIVNADDAYRDEIESTWQALKVERVAPLSSHAAFHRALVATCDSEWLLRLSTMLADRSGLMITGGLRELPAPYSTAEAHRELKEHAIAGQADAAAEALRRHLTGTIDVLRDRLG